MTKCDSTSAITARWSLRDPDGNWVIALTITSAPSSNATWVDGAAEDRHIRVDPRRRYHCRRRKLQGEPSLALAGTAAAGTARSRADNHPARSRFGPRGRSTTIHLFGKNMPAPAVVHVFKGSVQLPVTLNEVRSTHGSTEAEIASARVDLSNAAPGGISLSADLPGGSTLIAPRLPATAFRRRLIRSRSLLPVSARCVCGAGTAQRSRSRTRAIPMFASFP